ncbi:MAG: DUF2934 domain-containing protein [Phycisphaerae bacterium]|nr:DUF2934 domain-containing protein [Phycisphaerae bacterium]
MDCVLNGRASIDVLDPPDAFKVEFPEDFDDDLLDIVSSHSFDQLEQMSPEEIPVPLRYIEERAYYRYRERGGTHGLDQQDWLDAEMEMKREFRCLLLGVASLLKGSPSLTTDTESANEPKVFAFRLLGKDTGQEKLNALRRKLYERGTRIWPSGPFKEESTVTQEIRELAPDDPRYARAAERAKRHKDPLKDLSHEECVRYQGNIVAFLEATGDIIAFAPTVEELREQVAARGYENQCWCSIPGPIPEDIGSFDDLCVP